MASTASPSLKAVNYDLLDEVYRFWFEHITDKSRIVLPDVAAMGRFFMGGDDFDGLCQKKFQPALEEIQSLNLASGSELLKLLPPRGPIDWLSYFLLLDQIPRNCFRGDSSKFVFTVTDPLALGVAQQALQDQLFSRTPVLRWNITYRFWLVLPLMHSESLEVHDRIPGEILTPLKSDIDGLLAGGSAELDDGSEEYKRALEEVQKRPDEARFLSGSQTDAWEKHVVILRNFGRYPHRNGPLGREMTTEEQKYLDEGGDTFAPPKNDEERAKWEDGRNAAKAEMLSKK